MHLTQNSQVLAVDAQTLTLGFSNAGARDSFLSGGCDEILRQAAIDVVGSDWKIETIVDPSAQAAPVRPAAPVAQAVPAPGGTPVTSVPEPAAPSAPPDWARGETVGRATDPEAARTARGAIQQTRPSGPGSGAAGAEAPEEDGHPDDPDADTSGLDTTELLKRELGAEVIDEIPHS